MKKILYVLHSGMTGGSFFTTKDLMSNIDDEYEIYLLSGENDSLRLYEFLNNDFRLIKKYPRHYKTDNPTSENMKWSAKEFHNSWLTYIYFDILTKYDIDLVHIMHLINHSFDLPAIAKKLDIPTVLSIHDFYYLCPFYTLLDENKKYCGGVCKNNNENCYIPMDSLNDINSKEFIGKWRENVLRMFESVDTFISTSNIIKELFISTYPQIKPETFKIIEHGRDLAKIEDQCYEVPVKNEPIKILCFANHLNEMKGSEVIKNIKREDKNNLIEFHFLGNCYGIDECGTNHGRFERQDFPKKVREIKPSFVGIFSIWPETYCYAITESWICGIPVLGSNIGVVEDRVLKNNGGWIIDINNPKKTYEQIIEISNNPQEYSEVTDNINRMNFKSTREMAGEYKDIYNKFLKGEPVER
ncbi:glycosyltransferase [Methanobrevibacter sp.]|uniref:glycosyltransferase n=1 Tax=Methanobrevibacter sp. TaxID=66852 RepID=UPI00389015E5